MMYSCSHAFNQFPVIMHQSCMHVCKTIGAHESPKGWQLIWSPASGKACNITSYSWPHALVLYC